MKRQKIRPFRSALAVLLVLLMILPAVGCAAGKGEVKVPEKKEETDQLSLQESQVNAGKEENEYVLVAISQEESMKFRTYTPDDFQDVFCFEVTDLTREIGESLKNEELILDRFHQILCLNLNVQQAKPLSEILRILNEREDVVSTEPEIIRSICVDNEKVKNGSSMRFVRLIPECACIDSIMLSCPNFSSSDGGKTEPISFADDRVLVVLTHEESTKFKTYTPEDFGEISCVNVQNITAGVAEKVKNGELPSEDFKVILVLKLNEKSEEAVLSAIEVLKTRDDVFAAQPDYAFKAF